LGQHFTVNEQVEDSRPELPRHLTDQCQLQVDLDGGRRGGQGEANACRQLDHRLHRHIRDLGLGPGREPPGDEPRIVARQVERAGEGEDFGIDGNAPHGFHLNGIVEIGLSPATIRPSAPTPRRVGAPGTAAGHRHPRRRSPGSSSYLA